MTKKEFINNPEPLTLIVGLDINTGKTLFDTHPIDTEKY